MKKFNVHVNKKVAFDLIKSYTCKQVALDQYMQRLNKGCIFYKKKGRFRSKATSTDATLGKRFFLAIMQNFQGLMQTFNRVALASFCCSVTILYATWYVCSMVGCWCIVSVKMCVRLK